MQPSTPKPDGESPKPADCESRIGDYVDRVSGASRLEDDSQPDHTYAKPSVWRPQNYLVKPCRYLFPSSTGDRPPRPRSAHDASVDVETVDEEVPVPFPPADAPATAPADPEPLTGDEELLCWAERISKTGWSPVQVRILPRVLRVVEDARLHRLACRGRPDERFLLEEALESGRSRLSALLAGVGWDPGVTRWLHTLLTKHLSPVERDEYLAMLGRLRGRAPAHVEVMTAPGRVPTPGSPLDRQVADALLGETFPRLPLDPLFFVVPNSPECARTDRFLSIISQLRQMAQVTVVALPPRARSATVQQGLDQMVAEARARLAEARGAAGSSARPLVLIGWNVGAAIASLLAQLEPARAAVCLGYPYRTLDGGGDHRQSNLSAAEATCPVMFVSGSTSLPSGPEDAEEVRSRMRVPNRLVVVGGCDDRLTMSRPRRSFLRVTQSMVDRVVLVEIYNFVGETLTQPPPSAPRTPARFAVPAGASSGKRRGEAASVAPAKQRRLPRGLNPGPTKLIVINAAKYAAAALMPHHNYAARPRPAPVPMPASQKYPRGPN